MGIIRECHTLFHVAPLDLVIGFLPEFRYYKKDQRSVAVRSEMSASQLLRDRTAEVIETDRRGTGVQCRAELKRYSEQGSPSPLTESGIGFVGWIEKSIYVTWALLEDMQ